jgi:hypothetical protein
MVSNLHIPVTHKFTFTITFLTLFVGVALGASPDPISASSKSPYESGYDHGCDDSELKAEDRYINEPGKGASFHTDEFMDGYRTGYQECKEGNSNDSENDDEPSSSVNSDCFNEGYNDGKDNPFSLEKYRDCGGSMGAGNNAYYNGFVAGCLSVSGNTAEECEQATDT